MLFAVLVSLLLGLTRCIELTGHRLENRRLSLVNDGRQRLNPRLRRYLPPIRERHRYRPSIARVKPQRASLAVNARFESYYESKQEKIQEPKGLLGAYALLRANFERNPDVILSQVKFEFPGMEHKLLMDISYGVFALLNRLSVQAAGIEVSRPLLMEWDDLIRKAKLAYCPAIQTKSSTSAILYEPETCNFDEYVHRDIDNKANILTLHRLYTALLKFGDEDYYTDDVEAIIKEQWNEDLFVWVDNFDHYMASSISTSILKKIRRYPYFNPKVRSMPADDLIEENMAFLAYWDLFYSDASARSRFSKELHEYARLV